MLSEEDSSFSQAKETFSHENAGGMAELSVLNDREPYNQDNHDDGNESERADTSNDALPLLDFRKPGKKRALAANCERSRGGLQIYHVEPD